MMHISSGSMHGLGSHGDIDSLQRIPVNPGGQSQRNMPKRRLMQVALLKHGSGSQSSMSTEQRSPVKPSIQSQVWVEFPSMHIAVPVSLQLPSPSGRQKSMSVSHMSPVHPG